MLIEGTHFLRGDITPYRLGWKSAAVNISDIAAMGGTPTATFLSKYINTLHYKSFTDSFLGRFSIMPMMLWRMLALHSSVSKN